MDIAKDGSITSPVDDIPELSFRGKKGGCAREGGSYRRDGQAQQGAQVKSRGERMMPFHSCTRIRAQASANSVISRNAFKQVSRLELST